jgi:hypothetical protein
MRASSKSAVHRTIVVVDVEGFGDRRLTNAHQVAVRDGLHRVMREAFGHAGSRGTTAATRIAAMAYDWIAGCARGYRLVMDL